MARVLFQQSGVMFKDEYSVSGGASGAIFGVVGALLVIVIKNRGQLEDLSSRQLMYFCGIFHLSWCNKCRD